MMNALPQAIAKATSHILPSFLYNLLLRGYLNLKFRKYFLPNRHIYLTSLRRKKGVEIGGPSHFFSAILPIYSGIKSLDGVNYAKTTKWEGSISEGRTYKWFGRNLGVQYISECTNLSAIDDASYEFLISSNCLEHTANPLKALHEWLRVTKPGGFLLLVIPKKDNNFDNRRRVTEFSHLMDDFAKDMGEEDTTHLQEVLNLHDLDKDINAGDFATFSKTCLANATNREMHHHVFDVPLVKEIFEFFEIELIQIDTIPSDNIFLGKIPSRTISWFSKNPKSAIN